MHSAKAEGSEFAKNHASSLDFTVEMIDVIPAYISLSKAFYAAKSNFKGDGKCIQKNLKHLFSG